MKRQDFSNWPCSIARVSDLIGDGWSPLILRDAAAGLETFGEFQGNLGISRNTLAQRLNHLVGAGFLSKKRYSERPERYRYVLTEMGREFAPVLLAMAAWGDKWLFDGKPPYRVRHTACGKLVEAEVTCGHCRKPLHLDELDFSGADPKACVGAG